MLKTNNLKKTAAIAVLGFFLLFGIATTTQPGFGIVGYGVGYDRPVVMIDVSHTSFDSSYTKFATLLGVWGFDVIWNEDEVTTASLATVDVLIIPSAGTNYTQAEEGDIATWFDTGDKGLWVSGDSDYYGPPMAYRPNHVLNAVGSNLFVELGAVESEYNFGGSGYRVSGIQYNTEDPNSQYLTAALPYQGDDAMALFHGPAAVIGKNSTGGFVNLEENITDVADVEWVVRTQNGTIIFKRTLEEAEGAQAHTNNEEGNFTLMALQHSAGAAGTSKIVVSGEAPFSTYKNMFNDPGEYETPHNDLYLVYNTMNWFAGFTSEITTAMPVILVDLAHTTFDSSYDKFITTAMSWGYEVRVNDEDNISTTELASDVDILMIPSAGSNYSTNDLNNISDWFDLGNKGIWVAGDSDYYGPPMANRPNHVLNAIGSNIYVELGAVESEYNFGGSGYRVSGIRYNTEDPNAAYMTNGLPYQGDEAMALFHGPAAVIGKNGTGHFVDLEDSINEVANVEWVVRTQNGTIIFKRTIEEAEGAQAHTNNEEGNFTLMASQHSAGGAGTSKIIVSGEAPFSTYKNMFNDPGEYEVPHNDYYLVYNTLQWFLKDVGASRPVVMIDVSHTTYDSSYLDFRD
ncbi:MAG: hypothetical protein ACXAC7_10835, partial [Candidatus Hodarchaeales archaeon]